MNTAQYVQRMREDMELRRLAEGTQWNYEKVIRIFLKHSGKGVEELDEQDVREYSMSLTKLGLQASTFNVRQATIRFSFAVTLNRIMDYLQMPRAKKKALLEILSREEVTLLLERCGNLKHKVQEKYRIYICRAF